MQQVVYLTGVKRFKDMVEGKSYDSTTVYCLLNMDTSTGDACGQAGADFKFGTSDNFPMVQQLLKNGPIKAILELEQVTSGKAMKTIVKGVRPAAEAKA